MIRRALWLLAGALALGAGPVPAQMAADLAEIAPGAPLSGRLSVIAGQPGRPDQGLRLRLDLPMLGLELGALAAARGNLGTDRLRVFLPGPVGVTGVRPLACAGLRAVARLEYWEDLDLFGDSLSRVARTTHDVDLVVCPVWQAEAGRLRVEVTLEEVHDFPDEAEQWLRAFAGGMTVTLDLLQMSAGDLAAWGPEVAFVAVYPGADGLGLSWDLDLALRGPQAAGGLMAIIGWLGEGGE